MLLFGAELTKLATIYIPSSEGSTISHPLYKAPL